MVRGFRNIQILNLSGVLLSIFAFTFGPWLGQRQSALGILIDLWGFLSSPNTPAEVGRQQTILIILIALSLCLIGQAVTLYKTIGKRTSRWMITEALFSLTALGLLSILFSYYRAQTTGVIVTALGTLVAGGCALSLWLTAHQEPEVTVQPQPGPKTETNSDPSDPMLDFQRKITKQFLACTNQGEVYTLSVIGIAHYESYATVFGDDEARELTHTLLNYTHELYPLSIATDFSVGVIMIALPGVTSAQLATIIEALTLKMRQHGFAGEMLLPNGQIELIGSAAMYPDNGSNIGKLIEFAISSYSDVYSAFENKFLKADSI